jgi:putative membrane protein
MPDALTFTPYCGTPPAPGGVAWNFDPWLIAALLAGAVVGARRAADRRLFLGGWAVLAALLLSPLCNLSVALFSARVAQHVLLLTVAAPLIGAGLGAPRRGTGPGGLALAAFAFALLLWAWHLPAPYALTFRSDLAYWAMQGGLVASAAWLWRGLLLGAAARPDAVLLAGVATAAQMGGLGALLTFAPRPLFVPHALTTLPWGLAPIEDQQLGGLLMWVPGGLAFALVALPALARALRADPAAPRA